MNKKRFFVLLALALVVVLLYLEASKTFPIVNQRRLPPDWASYFGDVVVSLFLTLAPFLFLLLVVFALWYVGRDWRAVREAPDEDTKREMRADATKDLLMAATATFGLMISGTWMQQTVVSRSQVSERVKDEYVACARGRELLARTTDQLLVHLDGKPCKFCVAIVNRLHDQRPTSGAASPAALKAEGADSKRTEPTPEEEIIGALNFAENVLYLRHVKAMSETEFHAMWAGPVRRILDLFYRWHYKDNEALQEVVRFHAPLLNSAIESIDWSRQS